MKKAFVTGIFILVALVVLRVAIGLSSHPSDQQQIQTALDDSIQASREGRPGGVLDLLSKNLTFNGEDASGYQGQVAQFIKKQRPDVTVVQPNPIVTGDEAQIVSPVNITVSLLGQTKTFNLKDVILTFHREQTMKFLIFPTTRWELTEVRAQTPPALDISQ